MIRQKTLPTTLDRIHSQLNARPALMHVIGQALNKFGDLPEETQAQKLAALQENTELAASLVFETLTKPLGKDPVQGERL